MGNFPACLISVTKLHRSYSSGDHEHGDADVLTKVIASRVPTDDLLKPCILHSNKHTIMKGNFHELKDDELAPPLAADRHKSTDDNLKTIKKVRFADKVMLISTSTTAPGVSISSHAKLEGQSKEFVQEKIKTQSGNNTVRMKMVISKKQLSELLTATATRGKQSSSNYDHALNNMASILAPLMLSSKLVSSHHKISVTSNVHQYGSSPYNWRASNLEQTSEDH